MYLRAAHAELHIPTLRDFIKKNPLGIFTTAIAHPAYPLIQCSHIPFILDVDDSSETELGCYGSYGPCQPARQSTHGHRQADPGSPLKEEVMILFNGPHHYTTPKFYTATKPTTGKVVPTWNYAAVQAYGEVTIHLDTDPASDSAAFLRKQVHDLSVHAETEVMGYPRAWTPADAPDSYIALMAKAIVAVEIKITRLEGKFKMSQELGVEDRKGVVSGFTALETDTGGRLRN
ncbi:transcriptional regulator [Mycena leptocephala]|nr:transcriptional regulator [Mycena leptocephala]